MATGIEYPARALEWMTAQASGPVLAMSSSVIVPKMLQKSFPEVFYADRDVKRATKLRASGIATVVARAEALPFVTCHFGTVVIHQVLAGMAPGLALPELARVLKSGGQLAVSSFARDDGVPWVKRLIALMRSVDPDAMTGSDGDRNPLLGSKFFPDVEKKSFSVYVPVDLDGMLSMVVHEPSVAELPESDKRRILGDAKAIFDSATSGRFLRLPYQLHCYRAQVDHSELTAPLRLSGDDALVISF